MIAVTQLERLHAKHILPGFADKTVEEREIASLTTDITRELRRCQHIIAKIAQTAKNMPFSTTLKEDRVMIQNVQTALATKTQEISTIFRKKQSNYLKREWIGQQRDHYTHASIRTARLRLEKAGYTSRVWCHACERRVRSDGR